MHVFSSQHVLASLSAHVAPSHLRVLALELSLVPAAQVWVEHAALATQHGPASSPEAVTWASVAATVFPLATATWVAAVHCFDSVRRQREIHLCKPCLRRTIGFFTRR